MEIIANNKGDPKLIHQDIAYNKHKVVTIGCSLTADKEVTQVNQSDHKWEQ